MCELEDLRFDIAATAGWYSAIAGLLAGFAMLAILFPLDHETRDRDQQAGANGVVVFTSAFFALLVLAFTYAILSGRPSGAVAGHEQQLGGVAFGLSSLLMVLGLREVLRLYGGNRGILEPANALMARVTGIFGPLIIVAFGFSNALDVEAFRASAAPSEVVCVAGVPSGVWINVALSGIAVVLIALIPVILRRRRESGASAAMIGHATFVFTVAVAVWTGAIVPFLPTDVVSGAILEHTVVGINLVGAVAFGAAAWVSRPAPVVTEA